MNRMLARRFSRAIVFAGLLTAVCGCSTLTAGTTEERIQLTPCEGERESTRTLVALGAECGEVEVFENRKTKEGRKIALRVARIPALARNPRPDPLFILAGGPGQAATTVGPQMMPYLKRIQALRDIVLVDQRGTGGSHALECKPHDANSWQALLQVTMPEREVAACVDSYGADLRHYTTDIAMDDLDEVRRGLGYDRINLYGGSYGTRAALVYLRRHPDRVRSVILDGVAPIEMRIPSSLAADAEAALSNVFKDCRSDDACRETFPALEKTLDDLLVELEASPARVELAHPRTGDVQEVELTRTHVTHALHGALYVPETAALIPLAIQQASRGHYEVLVALMNALTVDLSYGMHLAVLCNEDVPRILRSPPRNAEGAVFRAADIIDRTVQACRPLPHASMDPEYFQPIVSNVPVLILSGELDPATPPRWGESVLMGLENAKHVVVPGAGHGTLRYPCVSRMMAEFVHHASAASLDTSCLSKQRRVPFFLSRTGTFPQR